MNGKKISAHVIGGALAIIAVWLINSFTKVIVTAEVAVAFGTVFGFIVSVLTPDNMEADEDAVGKSQGGFAHIGQLIVAALIAIGMALAVVGCAGTGLFKPVETINVPTTLPQAGQEAQKVINEANVLLAATYRVIGENAASGVWTKAQAQKYQDTANDYSAKVDNAQKALDLNLFTDAKSQADVVGKLLAALNKEVAAQARKAEPQ